MNSAPHSRPKGVHGTSSRWQRGVNAEPDWHVAFCRRDLGRGHAMWVRAWSNGRPVASGAGYGLKVSRADRDHRFKSSWRSVRLLFQDGECVSVPISASFWRDCTELRSSAIGRWLLRDIAGENSGRVHILRVRGAGRRA